MAQQLNLYHPRFEPSKQHFTARQGAWALLACAGVAALAVQGLYWAARDATAKARSTETTSEPLRQHLLTKARSAPPAAQADLDAEIAKLKALEADQLRILAALDAGVAGARDGHAGYLTALARQTNGQVWITGFSVTEGGDTLVLDGRMLEPHVLADYLRRLNAEPRFKGRPFAQFHVQAVSGNTGQPLYTEFSLRAAAAGASHTTHPHAPTDLTPRPAAGSAADALRAALTAANATASPNTSPAPAKP